MKQLITNWENIPTPQKGFVTQRYKVPQGWIVRTVECHFKREQDRGWFNKDQNRYVNFTESTVFVPDPNHKWKLVKEVKNETKKTKKKKSKK